MLAAEESGPRTDWRSVRLDDDDFGESITGDPSTLRFNIDGVAFKPFYETYGRYSAYPHVIPQWSLTAVNADSCLHGGEE